MLGYNIQHGEFKMAAGTYDITIDQGSDFTMGLALTELDAPQDLTGYSARAQMRAKVSSTTAAGTFVCTVTDALAGAISVTMSNTATTVLTPGVYFYDLELYTAADAIVTRILQGKAVVRAEITR